MLTDSSAFRTLLQHRWTILHPAEGFTWFTSDCPVIRLNYYKKGQYDFKGGWGRKGGEILFPLSPHHLMYTKIGDRKPWRRGTTVSPWFTEHVQQMIAEHAYRYIFAAAENSIVSKLRPRIVNRDKF